MTLALFALSASMTLAEQAAYPAAAPALTTQAMLTLPDSPGHTMATSSSLAGAVDPLGVASFDPPAKSPLPTASPYVKFIAAGRAVTPQTAGDKFIMGLRESVTPFSLLAWIIPAGYSHLTDGPPNYGTNSTAFAQRLGGSTALSVSKEIFSDSVMAPILHQDPRYYQLGPSQPFLKRVVYAATRPIIGRTNGGRTIPNFAFLAGSAGAAVLTKTYYPPRNQTNSEVLEIFGTTLGGSAIGYGISEFGGELAQILHIAKHK
jgi:hypothetical protein